MSRLASAPFHPVLFAAAFILQPAALNGVEPPGYVRALLVAGALAAGATLVLLLATRRAGVAGVLATVLLLLAISREPISAVLVVLRDALGTTGATIVLGIAVAVLLWIVVLAAIAMLRRRMCGSWLIPTTRALNVFGAALVVVALVIGMPVTASWLTVTSTTVPDGRSASDDHPDVYVLMLDGYARADELERQFGYDAGPFLAALEAEGLTVDEDSRSNYTYSALTFTSMLEVDHIREASEASVHDAELRDRFQAALVGGRAMSALHAAGYEVVAMPGGWEHDTFRGRVDRFLDRPELTDFERQVLQRTWLLDLPAVPSNLFFAELHKRIEGVLADAVHVAAEERSHAVFAFVHVPAPHLPMAFGSDGAPLDVSSRQYGAGRATEFGMTEEAFRAAYRANLDQLNRRVLEAVRGIHAATSGRGAPSPAIIVLSDHGFISDIPVHGPPMLANLMAARLPGVEVTGDDLPSPVNLVPWLLAAYGDSQLEPAPERFFTTVIDGQTLHLTEIPRP